MNYFRLKRTKTAKAVSAFVGFAMALSFVVMPVAVPAQAATSEELQAQINSLLQTITALQAQLSSVQGGTTSGVSYTFTKDLKMGSTGTDVMNLQKVLNMNADTRVSASGVGSAGNESSYFGAMTKAAVIKFQEKYASETLTPAGLTKGTGYVGALTRAKLNTVSGTVSTTGGTTGTTVAGTGLTVSSATQPNATLAPESATRVPFTKITLMASADGDITVNSLTIERTGLAADAVFAGVTLLDEDGSQIGIAKTFNSNHQAVVGDPFVVKAGTSKTITVAGNMAASLDSYAGQVASLSVVAVNTSATVSGSLPIVGTSQTLNATLAISSITGAVGTLDPNSAAVSKEIGTTGYTFSAVKLTAGSTEKVRVHSIRWNQSGSASASDLANIKVYVDGVAYNTTVSSDGKYYTAMLGSGIVIDKGLSKELSVKGDILSGSGRSVMMDIYKSTDIYVTGETYGYGITPADGSGTLGDGGSQVTAVTPWYNGSIVNISAGSVSSIAKASSVVAQNISILNANQPLGGFEVEVKGESVTVQNMIFNLQATGDEAENITNISLVDQNGNVVAGPVNGVSTATDSAYGTVTFTDTVTFPVGKTTVTLKGQLGSAFASDDTVQASTTPSTQWTTVKGSSTGNTISLSTFSTAITGNLMTVKAGAITVTPASSPVSQSVVMGQTGFTFANMQFDATASGEDVRFNSAQFRYTASASSDITNCYAYDGSLKLNNTAVQPTTTATAYTFTFDNALIVPKGTVKTVVVKCDIPASLTANDSASWGINSGDTISGTGVASGQTVSATHATAASGTMTFATAGTFTVTADASSPSYALAAAGSTGVVSGVLKFTGTNEPINLSRVALKLTNTASSSPSDVVRVTLWDGSTQVGSALFTGTNTTATSTLTSTFQIPKDGTKTMTVKLDLSRIGNSEVGTEGALVAVDYDNNDPTGTEGVGASSGQTIDRTSGSSTAFSGVRMMRSFPTLAKVSVPTNTLNNGQKSLLRFKVTADAAGDVGVHKFTLNMATTTASVTDVNIYAYTDSGFSTPVSGLSSDGGMLATAILASGNTTWVSSATDLEFTAQDSSAASTTIQVPAGTSRYFEVRGTVASSAAGASVSTQLQGDAAYVSMADVSSPSATAPIMLAATNSGVDEDTNDDFIWSPNATTTSTLTHVDWANGYGVIGLPSSNMTAEVLSQ